MSLLQPLIYPLSDRARAFSTTRHGGVGRGSYASMNVTHYCGDDAHDVLLNRQRLAAWLGIGEQRIVVPHQTHQTEVRLVGEEKYCQPDFLEGVDALVTSTSGLCIGVSTADCIPVIIYDRVRHVAAAVHAGWRGTVARIVQKTIRQMADWCGSRPSDLSAVIGPGISLAAFEVGDEVYAAFEAARFDMSLIAKRFPASNLSAPGVKEKWHIDLWECNRQQLLACGVPDKRILLSGICTYHQCDDFFSARRLGIRSGRIYTGIMLLP